MKLKPGMVFDFKDSKAEWIEKIIKVTLKTVTYEIHHMERPVHENVIDIRIYFAYDATVSCKFNPIETWKFRMELENEKETNHNVQR